MKGILLNPSLSFAHKSRGVPSTVACVIGFLGLCALGFSSNTLYAALDSSLLEPLIKLGTLPPEDADGPFRHWNNQKKYFLVIVVNQTDVPGTELPFAQVDGRGIVDSLTSLGYQPLDPVHPILTGAEATNNAIMATIDEARRKEEEATLVVYYTGHGAVGSKDLWLQTAGQVKVGDGQGVKVSDLIVQARQTTTGKGFEGELVLILDACYSGNGTVSQGLTLGDLGKQTTILTSSADIQESFSLDHPEYPKMSAFTYALLQGMGADWAQADGDGDGILRWEELKQYTMRQLRDLYDRKALSQPMSPNMLTNHSEGFLAYQRKQVRVWRSSYRANLTTKEMNDILAAHLQTLGANPKEKPELPKDAQALAKGLDPESEDYYAKAIQATAEGRLQEARALFVKADQQSRTREQAEETRRQEALTLQQKAEAAKQAEQEKRYDLYLARARMETYDGKFTEAFTWYQNTVDLRPPKAPDLINEIGLAGLRAGKYPQAEPYLQQALQQREQDLDPKHPDIGMSLNNLAALYDAQGKYAEAEPLYQRALRIDEAALGPNHPDVARDLNNLGELYRAQEKYTEAEPLYQRALRINELALGANHPNMAIDLNNLALLYTAQDKYAEAEHFFQRAVKILEEALGADHPNVATALNNLALLYNAQGRPALAEPLFQSSFWIFLSRLGPDHPNVATVFGNYRDFLKTSGQASDEDAVIRKLQQAIDAQSPLTPVP